MQLCIVRSHTYNAFELLEYELQYPLQEIYDSMYNNDQLQSTDVVLSIYLQNLFSYTYTQFLVFQQINGAVVWEWGPERRIVFTFYGWTVSLKDLGNNLRATYLA